MAKPKADRKAQGQKPKAASKIKAESAGTAKAKTEKKRPVKYTTELGNKISQRLADGETLIAICRDENMPHERAVRLWALNPHHEFAPKYARAREQGYHRMADELIELVDDSRNDFMQRHNEDGTTSTIVDHEHIGRSRLRYDARKWLLSKALPKIYGDKLALTDADGGSFKVQFVA